MQTTNDMPIVYPPSFKTLGIPSDLNAQDADLQSKHGRNLSPNKEFHAYNTIPVLGCEGSWLKVDDTDNSERRVLSQTFQTSDR
jgi:dipeptidase E